MEEILFLCLDCLNRKTVHIVVWLHERFVLNKYNGNYRKKMFVNYPKFVIIFLRGRFPKYS